MHEWLLFGRTSFVVDTRDELVDAVKRVRTLDRAASRRHVVTRFSVSRMVDDCESIYPHLTIDNRAA